jgi:hypothetical protein
MKNFEPKPNGFNEIPNIIAYNLTYEFMNFMFFAYRMGLIIQSVCMNIPITIITKQNLFWKLEISPWFSKLCKKPYRSWTKMKQWIY